VAARWSHSRILANRRPVAAVLWIKVELRPAGTILAETEFPAAARRVNPTLHDGVDQSKASAGRDNIGRDGYDGDNVHGDKYVQAPQGPLSQIAQLKLRLQREMVDKDQFGGTIESLQRFERRVPSDGIIGLENKLEASGREDETFHALDEKERFAKLLTRWSLYTSGQEIFAYLLAEIDYKFRKFVTPRANSLDRLGLDALIDESVIRPILKDFDAAVFNINCADVEGMIYWLADRCFVRWHS